MDNEQSYIVTNSQNREVINTTTPSNEITGSLLDDKQSDFIVTTTNNKASVRFKNAIFKVIEQNNIFNVGYNKKSGETLKKLNNINNISLPGNENLTGKTLEGYEITNTQTISNTSSTTLANQYKRDGSVIQANEIVLNISTQDNKNIATTEDFLESTNTSLNKLLSSDTQPKEVGNRDKNKEKQESIKIDSLIVAKLDGNNQDSLENTKITDTQNKRDTTSHKNIATTEKILESTNTSLNKILNSNTQPKQVGNIDKNKEKQESIKTDSLIVAKLDGNNQDSLENTKITDTQNKRDTTSDKVIKDLDGFNSEQRMVNIILNINSLINILKGNVYGRYEKANIISYVINKQIESNNLKKDEARFITENVTTEQLIGDNLTKKEKVKLINNITSSINISGNFFSKSERLQLLGIINKETTLGKEIIKLEKNKSQTIDINNNNTTKSIGISEDFRESGKVIVSDLNDNKKLANIVYSFEKYIKQTNNNNNKTLALKYDILESNIANKYSQLRKSVNSGDLYNYLENSTRAFVLDSINITNKSSARKGLSEKLDENVKIMSQVTFNKTGSQKLGDTFNNFEITNTLIETSGGPVYVIHNKEDKLGKKQNTSEITTINNSDRSLTISKDLSIGARIDNKNSEYLSNLLNNKKTDIFEYLLIEEKKNTSVNYGIRTTKNKSLGSFLDTFSTILANSSDDISTNEFTENQLGQALQSDEQDKITKYIPSQELSDQTLNSEEKQNTSVNYEIRTTGNKLLGSFLDGISMSIDDISNNEITENQLGQALQSDEQDKITKYIPLQELADQTLHSSEVNSIINLQNNTSTIKGNPENKDNAVVSLSTSIAYETGDISITLETKKIIDLSVPQLFSKDIIQSNNEKTLITNISANIANNTVNSKFLGTTEKINTFSLSIIRPIKTTSGENLKKSESLITYFVKINDFSNVIVKPGTALWGLTTMFLIQTAINKKDGAMVKFLEQQLISNITDNFFVPVANFKNKISKLLGYFNDIYENNIVQANITDTNNKIIFDRQADDTYKLVLKTHNLGLGNRLFTQMYNYINSVTISIDDNINKKMTNMNKMGNKLFEKSYNTINNLIIEFTNGNVKLKVKEIPIPIYTYIVNYLLGKNIWVFDKNKSTINIITRESGYKTGVTFDTKENTQTNNKIVKLDTSVSLLDGTTFVKTELKVLPLELTATVRGSLKTGLTFDLSESVISEIKELPDRTINNSTKSSKLLGNVIDIASTSNTKLNTINNTNSNKQGTRLDNLENSKIVKENTMKSDQYLGNNLDILESTKTTTVISQNQDKSDKTKSSKLLGNVIDSASTSNTKLNTINNTNSKKQAAKLFILEKWGYMITKALNSGAPLGDKYHNSSIIIINLNSSQGNYKIRLISEKPQAVIKDSNKEVNSNNKLTDNSNFKLKQNGFLYMLKNIRLFKNKVNYRHEWRIAAIEDSSNINTPTEEIAIEDALNEGNTLGESLHESEVSMDSLLEGELYILQNYLNLPNNDKFSNQNIEHIKSINDSFTKTGRNNGIDNNHKSINENLLEGYQRFGDFFDFITGTYVIGLGTRIFTHCIGTCFDQISGYTDQRIRLLNNGHTFAQTGPVLITTRGANNGGDGDITKYSQQEFLRLLLAKTDEMYDKNGNLQKDLQLRLTSGVDSDKNNTITVTKQDGTQIEDTDVIRYTSNTPTQADPNKIGPTVSTLFRNSCVLGRDILASEDKYGIGHHINSISMGAGVAVIALQVVQFNLKGNNTIKTVQYAASSVGCFLGSMIFQEVVEEVVVESIKSIYKSYFTFKCQSKTMRNVTDRIYRDQFIKNEGKVLTYTVEELDGIILQEALSVEEEIVAVSAGGVEARVGTEIGALITSRFISSVSVRVAIECSLVILEFAADAIPMIGQIIFMVLTIRDMVDMIKMIPTSKSIAQQRYADDLKTEIANYNSFKTVVAESYSSSSDNISEYANILSNIAKRRIVNLIISGNITGSSGYTLSNYVSDMIKGYVSKSTNYNNSNGQGAYENLINDYNKTQTDDWKKFYDGFVSNINNKAEVLSGIQPLNTDIVNRVAYLILTLIKKILKISDSDYDKYYNITIGQFIKNNTSTDGTLNNYAKYYTQPGSSGRPTYTTSSTNLMLSTIIGDEPYFDFFIGVWSAEILSYVNIYMCNLTPDQIVDLLNGTNHDGKYLYTISALRNLRLFISASHLYINSDFKMYTYDKNTDTYIKTQIKKHEVDSYLNSLTEGCTKYICYDIIEGLADNIKRDSTNTRWSYIFFPANNYTCGLPGNPACQNIWVYNKYIRTDNTVTPAKIIRDPNPYINLVNQKSYTYTYPTLNYSDYIDSDGNKVDSDIKAYTTAIFNEMLNYFYDKCSTFSTPIDSNGNSVLSFKKPGVDGVTVTAYLTLLDILPQPEMLLNLAFNCLKNPLTYLKKLTNSYSLNNSSVLSRYVIPFFISMINKYNKYLVFFMNGLLKDFTNYAKDNKSVIPPLIPTFYLNRRVNRDTIVYYVYDNSNDNNDIQYYTQLFFDNLIYYNNNINNQIDVTVEWLIFMAKSYWGIVSSRNSDNSTTFDCSKFFNVNDFDLDTTTGAPHTNTFTNLIYNAIDKSEYFWDAGTGLPINDLNSSNLAYSLDGSEYTFMDPIPDGSGNKVKLARPLKNVNNQPNHFYNDVDYDLNNNNYYGKINKNSDTYISSDMNYSNTHYTIRSGYLVQNDYYRYSLYYGTLYNKNSDSVRTTFNQQKSSIPDNISLTKVDNYKSYNNNVVGVDKNNILPTGYSFMKYLKYWRYNEPYFFIILIAFIANMGFNTKINETITDPSINLNNSNFISNKLSEDVDDTTEYNQIITTSNGNLPIIYIESTNKFLYYKKTLGSIGINSGGYNNIPKARREDTWQYTYSTNGSGIYTNLPMVVFDRWENPKWKLTHYERFSAKLSNSMYSYINKATVIGVDYVYCVHNTFYDSNFWGMDNYDIQARKNDWVGLIRFSDTGNLTFIPCPDQPNLLRDIFDRRIYRYNYDTQNQYIIGDVIDEDLLNIINCPERKSPPVDINYIRNNRGCLLQNNDGKGFNFYKTINQITDPNGISIGFVGLCGNTGQHIWLNMNPLLDRNNYKDSFEIDILGQSILSVCPIPNKSQVLIMGAAAGNNLFILDLSNWKTNLASLYSTRDFNQIINALKTNIYLNPVKLKNSNPLSNLQEPVYYSSMTFTSTGKIICLETQNINSNWVNTGILYIKDSVDIPGVLKDNRVFNPNLGSNYMNNSITDIKNIKSKIRYRQILEYGNSYLFITQGKETYTNVTKYSESYVTDINKYNRDFKESYENKSVYYYTGWNDDLDSYKIASNRLYIQNNLHRSQIYDPDVFDLWISIDNLDYNWLNKYIQINNSNYIFNQFIPISNTAIYGEIITTDEINNIIKNNKPSLYPFVNNSVSLIYYMNLANYIIECSGFSIDNYGNVTLFRNSNIYKNISIVDETGATQTINTNENLVIVDDNFAVSYYKILQYIKIEKNINKKSINYLWTSTAPITTTVTTNIQVNNQINMNIATPPAATTSNTPQSITTFSGTPSLDLLSNTYDVKYSSKTSDSTITDYYIYNKVINETNYEFLSSYSYNKITTTTTEKYTTIITTILKYYIAGHTNTLKTVITNPTSNKVISNYKIYPSTESSNLQEIITGTSDNCELVTNLSENYENIEKYAENCSNSNSINGCIGFYINNSYPLDNSSQNMNNYVCPPVLTIPKYIPKLTTKNHTAIINNFNNPKFVLRSSESNYSMAYDTVLGQFIVINYIRKYIALNQLGQIMYIVSLPKDISSIVNTNIEQLFKYKSYVSNNAYVLPGITNYFFKKLIQLTDLSYIGLGNDYTPYVISNDFRTINPKSAGGAKYYDLTQLDDDSFIGIGLDNNIWTQTNMDTIPNFKNIKQPILNIFIDPSTGLLNNSLDICTGNIQSVILPYIHYEMDQSTYNTLSQNAQKLFSIDDFKSNIEKIIPITGYGSYKYILFYTDFSDIVIKINAIVQIYYDYLQEGLILPMKKSIFKQINSVSFKLIDKDNNSIDMTNNYGTYIWNNLLQLKTTHKSSLNNGITINTLKSGGFVGFTRGSSEICYRKDNESLIYKIYNQALIINLKEIIELTSEITITDNITLKTGALLVIAYRRYDKAYQIYYKNPDDYTFTLLLGLQNQIISNLMQINNPTNNDVIFLIYFSSDDDRTLPEVLTTGDPISYTLGKLKRSTDDGSFNTFNYTYRNIIKDYTISDISDNVSYKILERNGFISGDNYAIVSNGTVLETTSTNLKYITVIHMCLGTSNRWFTPTTDLASNTLDYNNSIYSINQISDSSILFCTIDINSNTVNKILPIDFLQGNIKYAPVIYTYGYRFTYSVFRYIDYSDLQTDPLLQGCYGHKISYNGFITLPISLSFKIIFKLTHNFTDSNHYLLQEGTILGISYDDQTNPTMSIIYKKQPLDSEFSIYIYIKDWIIIDINQLALNYKFIDATKIVFLMRYKTDTTNAHTVLGAICTSGVEKGIYRNTYLNHPSYSNFSNDINQNFLQNDMVFLINLSKIEYYEVSYIQIVDVENGFLLINSNKQKVLVSFTSITDTVLGKTDKSDNAYINYNVYMFRVGSNFEDKRYSIVINYTNKQDLTQYDPNIITDTVLYNDVVPIYTSNSEKSYTFGNNVGNNIGLSNENFNYNFDEVGTGVSSNPIKVDWSPGYNNLIIYRNN